jgi:hypothetical protein
MKQVDAATEAHLRARKGVAPVNLVWVEARNRQSGAIETLGLSNLDDTVTLTVIDGRTRLPVTRTYHGVGGNLRVDPIPQTTDLNIRTIRVGLSQISQAVQQLVRGYETRRAPIEVHRGLLDPATSLMIAPPVPRFVGWINGNPIETPAANGEGGVQVSCVSYARKLTFTNPLKKSDEQQRRRQGDRIRRYTDVAGGWLANISWGEEGKR